MFKLIFILLLGISIGYAYGYSDAKNKKPTVLARAVAKVGGSTRNKVNNDLDARFDSVDTRR